MEVVVVVIGFAGGRLPKNLVFGETGELSMEGPPGRAKVMGDVKGGDGNGVSKGDELLDDAAAGAVEGRVDFRRRGGESGVCGL